ncbi:MAG: four helix bundle protein [Desulforhabdus sp.]|jgi:four helix bundle protein|nr:four helix bundle protein [Desulforhabdus sp.]
MNEVDSGTKFRFQELDIWRRAVALGNELFDIAEDLETRKLYRFAEQLRAAGLSISNNIAEGSGSNSKEEFIQFLNIAKRSAFENANMILVFKTRGLISSDIARKVLCGLEEECKMITGFIRALK